MTRRAPVRHAYDMEPLPLDLDALIGSWRAAFESAGAALQAGSHDLPAAELRQRAKHLADERVSTAHLLEGLAHERHAKPHLVRLVAAPWEAKRLLGLPTEVVACVFNLDGVLIGSAAIHAEAWRETFDEFIARRIERSGEPIPTFDPHVDYPRHIHARPRLDGVREFLASRGISLPDGSPSDPPGAETVHGLANRKAEALMRRIEEHGIAAFDGARLYLELAQDAGVARAVVSASANAETMIDRARLTDLIDVRVDGETMARERLRRKPAADTLLAACRQLGVPPEHAAVFETTPDGVAAGRAGGFELVVGVDQTGDPHWLRATGADLVVADLGDILEKRLAA
jgi:HAD superfamily hydrolase (TIGR01509 family)